MLSDIIIIVAILTAVFGVFVFIRIIIGQVKGNGCSGCKDCKGGGCRYCSNCPNNGNKQKKYNDTDG